MTPDKSKKPLPSSTSFVLPEHPATYQQWKAALQRLKVLYLRGQWKHCIARCCQLLGEAGSPPPALHTTYLHFYCGLSYEATARLAHSLSTNKVQSLEQAKISYQAACRSLPVVDRIQHEISYDDACSIHLATSTETEILDYYQSSPCSSSPRNDASSPSSIESINILQDSTIIKPSPLRIRKSATGSAQSSSNSIENQKAFQTFKQPPSTPQPGNRPLTPFSRDNSLPFNRSTAAWLHISSHERYTADLASFAEMLAKHIATIEALIQATQEAHAMKYFGKRLASYGEDEAARPADLEARVTRLKAAGWRRDRFRPEKYQELCERALEEL